MSHASLAVHTNKIIANFFRSVACCVLRIPVPFALANTRQTRAKKVCAYHSLFHNHFQCILSTPLELLLCFTSFFAVNGSCYACGPIHLCVYRSPSLRRILVVFARSECSIEPKVGNKLFASITCASEFGSRAKYMRYNHVSITHISFHFLPLFVHCCFNSAIHYGGNSIELRGDEFSCGRYYRLLRIL